MGQKSPRGDRVLLQMGHGYPVTLKSLNFRSRNLLGEDEIYFVIITDDDSEPPRTFNFGNHALTPFKNWRENSLLS